MTSHKELLTQALVEGEIDISLLDDSILEPVFESIIKEVKSLALLHVISGQRPGIDQDISLASLRNNDEDALRLLQLLFPQASTPILIQILDVIKSGLAEAMVEAKRDATARILALENLSE